MNVDVGPGTLVRKFVIYLIMGELNQGTGTDSEGDREGAINKYQTVP